MTTIFNWPDSGIKVIKHQGRLDTNTSSEFEVKIATIDNAKPALVLDLTDCPYISSMGIRILIKTAKSVSTRSGTLVLAGLSPAVAEVIEMAGLSGIFRIAGSVEKAVQSIQELQSADTGMRVWQHNQIKYTARNIPQTLPECLIWKMDGIAGYDELSFSIGIGSPAEAGIDPEEQTGLFVTAQRCGGFIPADKNMEPEIRVAADQARSGVNVSEAFSFRTLSPVILQIDPSEKVNASEVAHSIAGLQNRLSEDINGLMLLAILNRSTQQPSFTIALVNTADINGILEKPGLKFLKEEFMGNFSNQGLTGITFLLGEVPGSVGELPLPAFIDEALTMENIVDIQAADFLEMLENPLIWIFVSGKPVPAAKYRLEIETGEGTETEPWKAFLIRRLYRDSAKIRIDQLHGGFSAQTYQVTSFDPEGRKMRPTVLKIASRAIILRESERCRQYALPYIFNNCAIVLGAEFYGDMGALRYNFVGIGGEKSKLKWLTHYYQHADIELVESLYDKVFLDILKPWHGQPVKKTIFPFKDHDPTLTFFPGIFEAASGLFNVDSDTRMIKVTGLERPLLNPYYFLKHEFSRRREESIDYYSGICHGDLNMQNILLDEKMNIYLIDFSETKPRSVISDYARLEAILMADNAPVETDEDFRDYIDFVKSFYNTDQLIDTTSAVYSGRFPEKVARNLALVMKLRSYALQSVEGNPDARPYYLAMLEWVLPIVCWTLPDPVKRVSMVIAGLAAEQVTDQKL